MVQSKTNKFDATATYILAVLCTCLQILAFSLVLASLVAPVPTGNTVSTFLTIKSTNVSDVVTIQLGALVSRCFSGPSGVESEGIRRRELTAEPTPCHHTSNPMQGDCLTQNGARRCTSSRMAPDYTPTYHAAGMPNELMATLPDRLPDLPGLLVFVTIATILSFLLNLPATLYQISPRIITRSQKLQAMVPFLVRCSMGFATAAFVFGLSGEWTYTRAKALCSSQTCL